MQPKSTFLADPVRPFLLSYVRHRRVVVWRVRVVLLFYFFPLTSTQLCACGSCILRKLRTCSNQMHHSRKVLNAQPKPDARRKVRPLVRPFGLVAE